MVERCQVCGTNVGCQSYGLAGDYKVMTCHTCMNGITATMYKMPEFLEWFVCERSMDAAAVAGLSADEIHKRAGEYFAAAGRLRAAIHAMIEKRSVFARDVLPKLKPPVMPQSKEDAEIIQHEVDQLPPVPSKPAKVYALGYMQEIWGGGEQLHFCGVYSTPGLREEAMQDIRTAGKLATATTPAPLHFGQWLTWECVTVDENPILKSDAMSRATWRSGGTAGKQPADPPPPATVYALAFSEWFTQASGRVSVDVKLCGVYASKEAMEKAKAKFIEADARRAKIDGRPQQTFAWYAWAGAPMGGEEAANG